MLSGTVRDNIVYGLNREAKDEEVIAAARENFDSLVNTDYAVVDFYGDFCVPCRELAPIQRGA